MHLLIAQCWEITISRFAPAAPKAPPSLPQPPKPKHKQSQTAKDTKYQIEPINPPFQSALSKQASRLLAHSSLRSSQLRPLRLGFCALAIQSLRSRSRLTPPKQPPEFHKPSERRDPLNSSILLFPSPRASYLKQSHEFLAKMPRFVPCASGLLR